MSSGATTSGPACKNRRGRSKPPSGESDPPPRGSGHHDEGWWFLGCGLLIGVAQGLGHGGGVLVAVVDGAGPEEAPQPVSAAAGDHVYVEVGHRLADPVVHGHERALGAHAVGHGPGHEADPAEQRAHLIGGQVDQGLAVAAGQHQHMARKQGPHIEHGHRAVVAHHLMARLLAGDDPAEQAVRSHRATLLPPPQGTGDCHRGGADWR